MQVGMILAAGSGSRMGQPKATLEINGERLIDRAVGLFHEAGIKDVVVILGAWQGYVSGAEVVINSDWESGIGSSLKTGLEYLENRTEYSQVIISLVDLPGMTSDAIKAIALDSHEIVVGSYKGKPGHPVMFSRKYWKEITQSAKGDVGARNFLKGRNDVLYIPLDHLAKGDDLDTPSDLQRNELEIQKPLVFE